MSKVFLLVAGSTLGAVMTFLLQKYWFSVVVASCVVGLLWALLGYYFKIPQLPLVVFAGSFVGMTSPSVWNITIIILGGIFTGLLYQVCTNIFQWFGGKLWTMAFVSTISSFYIVLLIKKLITKIKS